ncbi:MAG TPA: Na+/H+ antiporter NhaC [Myxococcota bacterium]|nr:Na+/H+ antiporter NhaC [Myxococcota bacterium]
MKNTSKRAPALWQALVPVVCLILMLLVQIRVFEGSPHLPLILASIVAALVGMSLGESWSEIERGIIEGIEVALKAILILVVVGILIGTWIASGVVPLLIDYGLRLLTPGSFLVATCLICSVVSIATGSSWTTAGTVGVALIGVGDGLGVSLPMTAGAIVSGAYFGDKMSPLSDTTNLAPAVAGSELFEHVRYMMYTTMPAYALALAGYAALGWAQSGGAIDSSQVAEIRGALAANFELSPVLLVAPIFVIGAVALRIPALPALVGGALLGGLLALWVQGTELEQITVFAQSGYQADTGLPAVDELLSRGGLESMMSTVALVLCALTFGGIMERTGQLNALATSILKLARSTGSLVLATITSCIGTNVIAPDQYLSIVIPGRMYRETFRARNLHAKLLSRTLEDSGTLSSPLVPWNTCGAFMSTTLLVPTAAYFPYAFVNFLTPMISLIIAFSGFRIARLPEDSSEAEAPLTPRSRSDSARA